MPISLSACPHDVVVTLSSYPLVTEFILNLLPREAPSILEVRPFTQKVPLPLPSFAPSSAPEEFILPFTPEGEAACLRAC